MDTELWQLLWLTFVAAVLADLSMVLGVVPFFFVRHLSDRLTGVFSAAAGGMMTAAGLVQLVGEGLDRGPGLGGWEVVAGLLVGAGLYALAARWVTSHKKFDLMKLRKVGGTRALLIVAAMTVHSLPEGIAIGVAFGSRDQALGLAVVSALAVHNVPEAIAITLGLRSAGVPVWRCMGFALLPFGMGLAAGAMTFLVIEDLLPEAFEKASRLAVAIAFVGGAGTMIILGRLMGL